MQTFHDLKVWEKPHALALDVYKVTRDFPHEKLYGLTSQLRRATTSIPEKIAERCGRNRSSEPRRFVLLLTHDLHMLPSSHHQKLNDQTCEIKRTLAAFINKLTTDN
jgi:four helix bundle protein